MAFKKRRAGGGKRYWRENRANGQFPTIIAQHDTANDYTVTFSKAFVRNGQQTSARLNRVERGHDGTTRDSINSFSLRTLAACFSRTRTILGNRISTIGIRTIERNYLCRYVRTFRSLSLFFSRSMATRRRVAPRRNGLRKLKRSRKWTTHVVTIARCTYGDCCVGIIKAQSPTTIITNIGRSVSNSVASPYPTQRLFIVVLIHVRRSRDRKFVIILVNTAK